MLLFWCFEMFSSMQSFRLEIKQQRSISKCINYPVDIIDQYIKKTLDRLYVTNQFVPTVPWKEWLIVLPFLEIFSMNLRVRFYKSVRKTLLQWKIVVFSPNIDWVICLNPRTSFLVFAPSLFTNFSIVFAVLLVMAKLNNVLLLELLNI